MRKAQTPLRLALQYMGHDWPSVSFSYRLFVAERFGLQPMRRDKSIAPEAARVGKNAASHAKDAR